jgi:hypothetical protein
MGQRQVFSWASALNQQTLETTLVPWTSAAISQPQVIQYGCTHSHLRALHITNLRVHLRLAGHSNK